MLQLLLLLLLLPLPLPMPLLLLLLLLPAAAAAARSRAAAAAAVAARRRRPCAVRFLYLRYRRPPANGSRPYGAGACHILRCAAAAFFFGLPAGGRLLR